MLAKEKPRIAIIGSGLSGLSSAYLLSNLPGSPFTVHLYEKSDHLGMDSASFNPPCECSKCTGLQNDIIHRDGRIDVPMRSFFPEYYPYLKSLYDHIKIPYAHSDNSMSFTTYKHLDADPQNLFNIPSSFPFNADIEGTRDTSKINKSDKTTHHPYFAFSCYLIFGVFVSLPDLPEIHSMFTSPLRFFRSIIYALLVVFDYLRLLCITKVASYLGWLEYGTRKGPFRNWTLAEFFHKFYFSNVFVKGAFFPLFSGVATCTFDDLEKLPATMVLDYVATCMPFGEMSFITSSVNDVVQSLSSRIDKLFLSTPVISIESLPPSSTGEKFKLITETSSSSYHHIIFATQSNQAVKILSSSSLPRTPEFNKSISILRTFPYSKSLVICHSDETIMPINKKKWKCMNFAYKSPSPPSLSFFQKRPSSSSSKEQGEYVPSDLSQTTHLVHFNSGSLNIQKKTISPTYDALTDSYYILQTTNPIVTPRKILSVSWFERCVVTMESVGSVAELWGASGNEFFKDEGMGLNEGGIQGKEGRWFVGSYAWPGIPLLEGCVASSVRVCKGICEEEGVKFGLPWEE